MRALDHKLFRDLWNMKGQATAIALVISSGVATFIMSVSTMESLQLTQAVFYRDYRFADVWASLKRAPESLSARIRDIPGVQLVETRVIAPANLDVEGYRDLVTGLIVSLPDRGEPLLNRTYLKRGRMPEFGRDDEVLVSQAFADAHRLQPGDRISAILNGRRKRLTLVGVVLSPEYIYQLAPTAVIPDFETYGILWMARKPLATAFNLEGGFNDVSLALSNGAAPETIIERLDELLARYGGLGAYSRKDQVSHRYLSEEFRQLRQMATMFPLIFLSVAAFLLNVVVSRLIATQREQIAVLKAFGYSNADVAVHYLEMIVLISLCGAIGGVAFGMWLGRGLSNMYMEFYRFPFLLYQLRPLVAVAAGLFCALAAILGTVTTVIRAARLPPAEAMQPAPPARYRVSLVERLGLGRWLAQPTRMIIRNIERRPFKALLSVVGVAFACAILVTGGFFNDSVQYLIAVTFRLAQRDDLMVSFVEPTSQKALYSLRGLPGVDLVEPFRAVPVRLRFEHRSYRTSLQGVPPDATLRRILDRKLEPVAIPPRGVVLTDYLAGMLGIRPGEMLTVEALEGNRPVRQVPVVGLVNEYIGVFAYMSLDEVNRFMREAVSGAYLSTDPRDRETLYARIKRVPRVAGTIVRQRAMDSFNETLAKQVLTFAFFNTILAGTIAVGVVYNSARIAFSERSRELASLRVLGFTRGEISYILLGELALLTLVALPVGCLIGRALCAFMIRNLQTEIFRIPLVVGPGTYSFSVTVVLVAAVVSGLLVRRKLDHLDLVAVLKTKE